METLTRRELITEVKKLQKEKAIMQAEIGWFKEQFGLSKKREFGVSSEKSSVMQLDMGFNEAEAVLDASVEAVEPEAITCTRKPKSKGHREEVLENIPTEVIEHKLGENEQLCEVCGGHLHEMSTQSRDEIVIIPAQVKVLKHVTSIYSCRNCEKNEIQVPILKAPSPKPLVPKSLASPSSVAYVMSQKFVEAMPLYRQEKHFERLGIELPRANLSSWMLKGGKMLEAIYDRLHDELVNLDIVHADETTLQVLKEDGKAAQSKSYMWLYRSGRYGPPIVLYDYEPNRNGENAKQFLGDFAGYLHADGYAGYEKLDHVTLVGCWAHARRKFIEALVVIPKESRSDPDNLANIALKYINALYKIERDLRDVSPEERHVRRNELSKPILEAFKVWLDRESGLTLPKSVLGKALTYCRNQWSKLVRFLDDGRLEIDNNRAERSIKPFVIGRKNWLFSNTPRGAKTSAVIYSIVETAKENGLDPYAYLRYALESLSQEGASCIERLFPWNEEVQAALKPSVVNP